jgi:hypothetical protein
MNELNKNILDFSSVNKDRIYNDFNEIAYREFNESLFDINLFFGLREDHLFEILEKAYLENGPYTMRQEFNYLVKLLKLIFYKVENNDLFNFYELFYHYTRKYYKPRKTRIDFQDERQLTLGI